MSQDDTGLFPVDRARRQPRRPRTPGLAPTSGLASTLGLLVGLVVAAVVVGAVLGAVRGAAGPGGWTAESLMRLAPPQQGSLSPADSDRRIQSELVVLTGPQVRERALGAVPAPDDASVDAAQDGLTDFVTVVATAGDAEAAVALANAVPAAYAEVQQAAGATAVTREAEGVRAQLQAASERLDTLTAEPGGGTVVQAQREALTALVQQLAAEEQALLWQAGPAPGLELVLPATSAEPQAGSGGPVAGALLGLVVGLALAALLAALLRRRASSPGRPSPADVH